MKKTVSRAKSSGILAEVAALANVSYGTGEPGIQQQRSSSRRKHACGSWMRRVSSNSAPAFDQQEIGRVAGNHLRRKGHRKVAVIHETDYSGLQHVA